MRTFNYILSILGLALVFSNNSLANSATYRLKKIQKQYKKNLKKGNITNKESVVYKGNKNRVKRKLKTVTNDNYVTSYEFNKVNKMLRRHKKITKKLINNNHKRKRKLRKRKYWKNNNYRPWAWISFRI